MMVKYLEFYNIEPRPDSGYSEGTPATGCKASADLDRLSSVQSVFLGCEEEQTRYARMARCPFFKFASCRNFRTKLKSVSK
jgi:hypothetical protein